MKNAMEQGKKPKPFWVYILLAIQALSILALLPIIAGDVWLPSSTIDIDFILLTGFIFVISLPLWRYRKKIPYSFVLSVIVGLFSVLSLVGLFTATNPNFIDSMGVVPSQVMVFINRPYVIKNTEQEKQYDARMQVLKASTANQIISICNQNFQHPEKVISSLGGYDVQFEDANVSLFYPYFVSVVMNNGGSGRFDGIPETERSDFEQFVKTSLIGKEVSVKCPNYNDLMGVDSLSIDKIPVLLYLHGKILNAPPFVGDFDFYGKNPAQEIRDNYPAAFSAM